MKNYQIKGRIKQWIILLLVLSVAVIFLEGGCGGSGGGSSNTSSNGNNTTDNSNNTTDNSTNTSEALSVNLIKHEASKPQNITLNFKVEDTNGDPVPTLNSVNFEVTEEGESIPVNESNITGFPAPVSFSIYTDLMLDLSGSVTSDQLNSLIKSSKSIIDPLLKYNDKISVHYFQSDTYLLQSPTSNSTKLKESIEKLKNKTLLGSSTNLYGAVLDGLNYLKNITPSKDKIVAGNLMLFSDGAHETGTNESINFENAKDKIYSSDFNVYTVGLDTEVFDKEELSEFGKSGFEMAGSTEELENKFNNIAKDIEAESKSYYAVKYCTGKRTGYIHGNLKVVEGKKAGSVDYNFDANGFSDGACYSKIEYLKVEYYDDDGDGYYSISGKKHDCNDTIRDVWNSCDKADVVDKDGDHYANEISVGEDGEFTDCDDQNSDIHPGAEEVCDADYDCDGKIKDGCEMHTYYLDSDSDGYGDPDSKIQDYIKPDGYVTNNKDCDDGNADIHPGAEEVCGDNVDHDCDGNKNNGCSMQTYYQDSDGDGYGDPDSTIQDYRRPDGYVTNNTDCDDSNADIHPGAEEVTGDGIDNNCINDAPIDKTVNESLNEDGTLETNVSTSDPDGDSLTYSKKIDPSNGTLSINSDGSYIYTPDANFNGSDSFEIEAEDGKGATGTITVEVTVNEVNDAPTAEDVSVDAEGQGDLIIDLNPYISDIEDDDSNLNINVVSGPSDGYLLGGDGNEFQYDGDSVYVGDDSFTYKIKDSEGAESEERTVTIRNINSS